MDEWGRPCDQPPDKLKFIEHYVRSWHWQTNDRYFTHFDEEKMEVCFGHQGRCRTHKHADFHEFIQFFVDSHLRTLPKALRARVIGKHRKSTLCVLQLAKKEALRRASLIGVTSTNNWLGDVFAASGAPF